MDEAEVGMLVLFNGAEGEIQGIQGRQAIVSFDPPYLGRDSTLTCSLSLLVQRWPVSKEQFKDMVGALVRVPPEEKPAPRQEQAKPEAEEPSSGDIRAMASVLGRAGGKIGGPARVAKLTPEERSKLGRRGAVKRWDNYRARQQEAEARRAQSQEEDIMVPAGRPQILDAAGVEAVHEQLEAGATQEEIAKEVGVSQPTVSRVLVDIPPGRTGRPRKLTSSALQEAKEAIEEGASQGEAAQRVGVSRNTLGRALTTPNEEDDPLFTQLAEAEQSERVANAELLRAQNSIANVKMAIFRKGIFYIQQAGIDFAEIRALFQEVLMWLIEMEELSSDDNLEPFRELEAMKEAALHLHGLGLDLIPYDEASAAYHQHESGS